MVQPEHCIIRLQEAANSANALKTPMLSIMLFYMKEILK